MYCIQCGNKVESDSMFCPSCGSRVGQEKNDTGTDKNKSSGLEKIKKISFRNRLIVIGSVVAIFVICWMIANAKQCEQCGKTTFGALYYNPSNTYEIMCKKCIKTYCWGLPVYEEYRIPDEPTRDSERNQIGHDMSMVDEYVSAMEIVASDPDIRLDESEVYQVESSMGDNRVIISDNLKEILIEWGYDNAELENATFDSAIYTDAQICIQLKYDNSGRYWYIEEEGIPD